MILYKFTCKSYENNLNEYNRVVVSLSGEEAWDAFSYSRKEHGLFKWAYVCIRETVIDKEYDEYYSDFVESFTDGRGSGGCAMSARVLGWHNSIEEENNG